jgi:hypothetical protein
MLTRFHKILLGVLAVQIVLAVIVLTRGDDNVIKKERPLFAGLDAGKVTRVQVFGPSGPAGAAKPIDLVKHDASWRRASTTRSTRPRSATRWRRSPS